MPNRSTKGLWLLLVAGVAVVGAFGAYVKFGPGAQVPANERRLDGNAQKPSPRVDVSSKPEHGSVTIFHPKFAETGDLSFTTSSADVPSGEDARVFAVNQFLMDSNIAPAGARLLGIDVHDRVATLSFNSAFFSGYGTMDEQALVEGLRKTLGQFKEIEELDFRNQGRKAETLGNIELAGMKVER
jgi:hypothetical protein